MARWHTHILAPTLCLAAAGAAAQSTDQSNSPATDSSPRGNPSLTALSGGIRDAAHARDIGIRRLDVAVEVRGTVAETTVTTSFASKSSEQLEGEFKLQLPADAVITGYALDINGRLTDGVLVDSPKAKAVYEERIRRKVDPGLAEVTTGNVFSTRVFPITAQNGRTIRVKYVSTAARDGTINLPLITGAPVEGWSIAVHATGSAAPEVTLPEGNAQFAAVADGFALKAGGQGALDGTLAIRTIVTDLLVSRHRSGERYLQIGGTLPPVAAPRPERLRIYWDRSRSRLDDRLDAEIALVRDYISGAKPRSIELVAFNSSGARRITVGTAAAAASWLKGLTYRGATSFAAIAGDVPTDHCLLFSDGQVTIDRAARFNPSCRVDTITSAGDADRAWLGHVATEHGGHGLFLDENSAPVLADLRAGGGSVIGVTSAGRALPFVPLAAPMGQWRVLARAPAAGDVVIRYANGTSITRRVSGREMAFDGEGALIARDRLALLGATEQRTDYVALSRRYGIASPSLAFVVLETPRDYVTADVAPPADYPAGDRAEYAGLKKEADRDRKEARDDRLNEVVDAWNDEVEWWMATYRPGAPTKRPFRRGNAMAAPAPPPPPPPPPPPVPPPSPAPQGDRQGLVAPIPPAEVAPPAAAVTAVDATSDQGLADIVTTGTRIRSYRGSSAAPMGKAGTIELDTWQPDRPYLKAFDADPAHFDAIFAREEKKSGTLPAFYLDTAEWLRKHGRTADAIEMVMAALELPAANEVTLGFVADRLERYGAIDRAVELRERHVALDPDRPQPKRFLALALAHRAQLKPAGARADLTRAIGLLRDVALTPWSGDWDGIELVSLVEANAMIPRLRALGGKPDLDPRLIQLLDTDLRVVVDWTTDDTDLDLWVDEPTGERSIYSNQLTAIGGQLSNDMTNGYGPEQYLLRRAPNGTYKVQANVYASDQLDPNGASVLTAHLFRNYGRPNQTEEIVDVELIRGEQGGGNSEPRMIGRIVVGRKQ